MVKQKTEYATGAKNLKAELTAAFTSTKFKVTSERHAINVSWDDGPEVEDVEKIAFRYQKGNFDGMNDLYVFDGDADFIEKNGGARFVFCWKH